MEEEKEQEEVLEEARIKEVEFGEEEEILEELEEMLEEKEAEEEQRVWCWKSRRKRGGAGALVYSSVCEEEEDCS